MIAKTKSGKNVTIAAPNSKKDQALIENSTFDFNGGCLRGVYGKYDFASYHLVKIGYAYYVEPAT